MPVRALSLTSCAVATALACASTAALAQPKQVVKPPVAQAWIDIATFGGFGMPGGMGGMTGGGNPMAMLGGLLGRGGATNTFGQTQAMSPGRWVDVTLYTRNNGQLTEAQQSVPAGFLSPALKLQSPTQTKGTPPGPDDDTPTEPDYERPKGKMLLFWGCGEAVRAGQPRVVDFATATPADLGRFFQARSATRRGTHSAVGRPVWPSVADARVVPAQASLVGEHAYTGSGVPEGFRFRLGAGQDLMPSIALKQKESAGATQLDWQALPTARAYFIAAMGARENNEMVIWTSSEQPDIGFGLMDYQTNPAVDRWLKEKVLLAPQTVQCVVPKGVFSGEGAMVRMIAYGNELNLAHPPRPTDPREPWEPVWAAKVRIKSVTMAMLGQEADEDEPAAAANPAAGASAPDEGRKPPGVKDLLRGIFGR